MKSFPINFSIDLLDLAMLVYMGLNIVLIPHTKIEELFVVNNIHDHLYFKYDIPSYDFI